MTIWSAELRESILRQREILLEGDVRPSWFVNYGKQSSEKDLGFRIQLRWHQLDRRHRFRERHEVDRGAMQRHHLTKVAFMKGVYGMQSKSCGQHPIERRRATTTLYVSKNSGAGFLPGALGDL